MKRRHSFSLMEVMLAATLFAFIVSILFFWLHFSSVERVRGKKMQERALQIYSADKVLQNALTTVRVNDLFFTTEGGELGKTLLFTFDHGVDQDPLFSGKVLGRLFVDKEENELVFALFPDPQKEESKESGRRWVLLKNVKGVELKFFYPPSDLAVSPDKVGKEFPLAGWQERWRQEFKTIPAMVKLTLCLENELLKKEEVVTFAYEIPHFPEPIKK